MMKINIAGLKVDAITKKELLDEVIGRIKRGQKTFVITPYSEFLYHSFQNPPLLEIFNRADFSVADGIGLFWAKKFLDIPLTAKTYWGKVLQAAWQIKYSLAAIIFNPRWIKSALPEKIVGADLVWDLAKLGADNNLSIFLLGGFGNTPELAAKQLAQKFPVSKILGRGFSKPKTLRIAGSSNKNPDDLSVIKEINSANPDILLVAYGPIKQEKWIAEHLQNLNVKLAIGLGGTFDYIAGIKFTPPKFIRYSGLEWLWRLVTQPYRAKRIFNATFGLVWGLWHYKVFMSLPMRPNVAIIIFNQKKEILVCKRNPKDFNVDIVANTDMEKRQNYWQFPQGGIDGNETIVEAALREANEETGIVNLQFIKISKKTNSYLWGNGLRKFEKNKKFQNKGQVQHIAYFKFTGNQDKIKFYNNEFVNHKWVIAKDLDKIVTKEKAGLTKIVQEDLKDLA